ncbi:hypothetical protein NHG35_08430 [Aerococcaceae bacterium NML180378]|nr:hypothetical protein [Aerococcaceae bacterium NML180378]
MKQFVTTIIALTFCAMLIRYSVELLLGIWHYLAWGVGAGALLIGLYRLRHKDWR